MEKPAKRKYVKKSVKWQLGTARPKKSTKLSTTPPEIPAPPNNSCACNDCPHMKLNTLEKIYLTLKYEEPELILPAHLKEKARQPILRMLSLS